MTVKGANGNDAEEFVDAEYTGDALVIGVNSKYLAECLTLCNGDDVTLKMGGSSDPIIIIPSDDDGVVFVVMPTRI
jgi:DNA polymerase-3 subunit beta